MVWVHLVKGSLGETRECQDADLFKVNAEWWYGYECQNLGCRATWFMLEDMLAERVHCPECGSNKNVIKPGRKLVTVHTTE